MMLSPFGFSYDLAPPLHEAGSSRLSRCKAHTSYRRVTQTKIDNLVSLSHPFSWRLAAVQAVRRLRKLPNSFRITTYENTEGAGTAPQSGGVAKLNFPQSLYFLCLHRVSSSALRCPATRFLVTRHTPLPQNSFGSRAASSAIRCNSGYFSRSGSGTFTFVPLSIAISSRAFTTALPW